MRLLLTTDTVGGVWTFTRELAAGLLRRGHAVALVSFGRLPNAAQQAWVSSMRNAGDFIYEASEAPLEWMQENASTMSGVRVLDRVSASFAPDVLHSNQFCFGALRGFPIRVVTAHSDVLSWAAVCRPTALANSAWLRRYRELLENGLDGAHAITAPTAWMLGALARNFALPRLQQVILNGRDIDPPTTPQPAMQAVTAGRLWDEAKGLCMLENLNSPFPIHVAGEVLGEHMGALVTGGLHYEGSLAEEQLFALFRRSALYLATSIYEPFGLAPLEAALCGCAVVANDLPSLREVWGDAALYFNSLHQLQSLLLGLHARPALLADARARSQARARKLTATRMVETYLALYQSLLVDTAAATACGMVYAL